MGYACLMGEKKRYRLDKDMNTLVNVAKRISKIMLMSRLIEGTRLLKCTLLIFTLLRANLLNL